MDMRPTWTSHRHEQAQEEDEVKRRSVSKVPPFALTQCNNAKGGTHCQTRVPPFKGAKGATLRIDALLRTMGNTAPTLHQSKINQK